MPITAKPFTSLMATCPTSSSAAARWALLRSLVEGRRHQSIVAVVGHADHILVTVGSDDRKNRAEDLLSGTSIEFSARSKRLGATQ